MSYNAQTGQPQVWAKLGDILVSPAGSSLLTFMSQGFKIQKKKKKQPGAQRWEGWLLSGSFPCSSTFQAFSKQAFSFLGGRAVGLCPRTGGAVSRKCLEGTVLFSNSAA